MSFYFDDRAILSEDNAPMFLWNNVLVGSTVVASSEAVGGDAENTLDNNTYDYWTTTATPGTITYTLPSSKGVTHLGIAAHNLADNNGSVQWGHYNGSAWAYSNEIFPESNASFVVSKNFAESDQFRLIVRSDSDDVSIGVVFMGIPTVMVNGILPGYTPIYMAENITLYNSTSLSGQFIGNSVERRGYQSSFALNILEREFVEGEEFQAFRRHYNDGGTFFFASNPNNYRSDVAYCRRQEGGELKPNFPDTGLFYSAQISLEGFIK